MHDNLRINTSLMMQLMRQPIHSNSIEHADNRISLFSAQYGKCAVTGLEFSCTEEIHCHHKVPKIQGGNDKYDNLVLINNDVHRLVHAAQQETIFKYLELLNLNNAQLQKLNALRTKAGLAIIA